MSFERRIATALLICGLIWIAFDFFLPKPPEPEVAADEIAALEGADDPSADADGEPGSAPVKKDGPEAAQDDAAPTAADVEVVHHEIGNDLLSLKVTNRAPGRGGVIEEVDMLSEQFAGHSTADNALDLGGASTLEVSFADEATDFRIPAGQTFEVEKATATSFVLVHRSADVEVRKTLELVEGYHAKLSVEVRNLSGQEQQHRMHVRTRVGLSGEESRYNIKRGLCRTDDDLEYEDKSDVDDDEPAKFNGTIRWGGVDNKYFGSLVVPTQAFSDCEIYLSEDGEYLVNRMGAGASTLAAGESKTYEMGLFVGAKELERLQAFTVEGAEVHLEEAIDWGMLGGLSESLGRMLLSMMRYFYGWVGEWGWAIVLLTLVIKLTLLPLTIKATGSQMKSMKAMKRLKPQMDAIKKKYEGDRVKQGQEQQALFAREGVNPMAPLLGCFPMLLQMPIWIALYAMLGAAVELVHADFLWLPDLTKQDDLYLLPLGLAGMMFFQSSLMPSAGDEQQAKMMKRVMPLVMGAMFMFMPSGMGVYIFVNMALSVVQTAIQRGRNKDEPEETAVASKTSDKASKSTPKSSKKK